MFSTSNESMRHGAPHAALYMVTLPLLDPVSLLSELILNACCLCTLHSLRLSFIGVIDKPHNQKQRRRYDPCEDVENVCNFIWAATIEVPPTLRLCCMRASSRHSFPMSVFHFKMKYPPFEKCVTD